MIFSQSFLIICKCTYTGDRAGSANTAPEKLFYKRLFIKCINTSASALSDDLLKNARLEI